MIKINKKIIRLTALTITLCILLAALAGCGRDPAGTAGQNSVTTADAPTIYFFDAGDADSILISQGDFSMLIDCGNKGFGDRILSHLEECRIDHIDYLVISHFDKDHVGGAAQVLKSVHVGTVLQSVEASDSHVPEKYLKALKGAGITPQTVTENVEIESGDLHFKILAPQYDRYTDPNSNNFSLFVSMSYKENRILFTGDAEKERIDDYLSSAGGTYDLIKMPHHGKWCGNIKELLAQAQPAYAVICCGNRADVSDKTIKAMRGADLEFFFTSDGPVTAILDGTSIKILQK